MEILAGDHHGTPAGEVEQPAIQRFHQVTAELLRRRRVDGAHVEQRRDRRFGIPLGVGQLSGSFAAASGGVGEPDSDRARIIPATGWNAVLTRSGEQRRASQRCGSSIAPPAGS